MKFLVDAQLPPALCRWLRDRGEDATHVSEIEMLAASDRAIAARAEADGSVLVSKDDDFGYLRHPDRFALLWLRCGNASNRAVLAWLEPRWDQVARLLRNGERLVEVR